MNIWNGQHRRIYMQEVGTRDGFQSEGTFVETRDKIALIDALSNTGMAKIEVTAFVSPKAIPALSDAEIVMRESPASLASSIRHWCRMCVAPSARSRRARMS